MSKITSNEVAFEIEKEVEKAIKGMSEIIRRVNIALFAQGHILLEGLPGVAKTTLLLAFARTISGGFSRISGTPDIMPVEFAFTGWPDIKEGESSSDKGFVYYFGPLLKHGENLAIVLVDEINRIMAKCQSGLLEAMQEKKLTCGVHEFKFPHVLFVATRNPLETEETNELPEAQRDRFMFEGQVRRPSVEVRRNLIMDASFQNMGSLVERVNPIIKSLEDLAEIRGEIQHGVEVSEELANYIISLTDTAWDPSVDLKEEDFSGVSLKTIVRAGPSPRAEIVLAQASRVVAWMNGRDYVIPADVQEIFLDTYCHRFFLERVAVKRRSGLGADILSKILKKMPSPTGGKYISYGKA